MAAFAVGVATAAAFWGLFVPWAGKFPTDPEGSFMFTGSLNLLPGSIRGLLGWSADDTATTITGPLALGVMSVRECSQGRDSNGYQYAGRAARIAGPPRTTT